MPTTYNDPSVVYDASTVPYDGITSGTTTPYPNVGVFISFTDGPYTASPAWVDISTYVREINIHRGRSSDFDQFDTGTAQLVLDNRDRRFDPFFTAGPYYTLLTPRRQLRVVGQAGGVNYEVFRGYVAGWPVQWSQAGKDSTVTIQAFDALGLMANEIVPTDWPDYYTRSLSPLHYWKCNDSQTSAVRKDYGSYPIDINKNATTNYFEQPALGGGLLGTSTYFPALVTAQDTAVIQTQESFTLCFWGNLVTTGDSNQINYYKNRVRAYFYYSLSLNRTFVGVTNATGGTQYRFDALLPNAPFHIAIAVTSSSSAAATGVVYLNGQAVTATSTVAQAPETQGNDKCTMETGAFQEVFVVHGSTLSASQIQTIYNAGAARFSETTTARMNRLIGTTDYPTALTNFTVSPVASVAEIGSGSGVIAEMQLVADSEGGEIYVSKDGKITTTNRTDVFTATRSTVSQATFTDSGIGLSYGPELLIEYDGDAQKNDVTVQFSGDGEVNAYNDYATTLYGGQATTIETQLADPTSATNLALVELGVEGSLIPRISPIDVSTNTTSSAWQTILGLELLDRVTFKRTPTVGNQFNRDALINAIDHQIVPGVWNTQLTLSMRYTSPETLDDDVLGLLDLNYLG